MGPSSSATTQRPGRSRPTSGPPTVRRTATARCRLGMGCIPSHSTMPRRAPAQPHARPLVRGTLLRLEVDHLPRPTKTPQPLWFWWWGPTPPDLAEVWQAYVARYSIEHSFRFFKQTLKWPTPKLRRPEAADRWTWLLVLAFVQLRLARDQVADVRLPWQRPLPPERRTPARVRRGFSSLLAQLGSPANLPKPCGRSPGRPRGQRSQPAQRFPAIKLSS